MTIDGFLYGQTTGADANRYQTRLAYSYTQDVLANQTTLTVSLQAIRNSADSSWGSFGSRGIATLKADADEQSYTGITYDFRVGNTWHTLASHTFTVDHEADGNKTVILYGYFSVNDSSVRSLKTCTVNGSLTLEKIPRASQFGVISPFMIDGNYGVGVPFWVPVTRFLASYYDVLEISYNGTTIAEREGYTSGTVTLTADELQTAYNTMSAVNSAEWVFTITTYKNSLQAVTIGQNTVSAIASISPTGRDPVFSIGNISYEDVDASAIAVTGDSNKYIKSVSDLQIVLEALGTAQKGATMAGYTFMLNGINKYLTALGSVTFDDIESGQFTAIATDSRGNSASVIVSLDITDWKPPVISSFTAERTAPDLAGTIARLRVSGKYSTWSGLALNNSIQSARYRYNDGDDWSAWQSVTVTQSGGNYSLDTNAGSTGTFDVSKTYLFEFEAYDRFGNVLSTATMISATPLIMWDDNTRQVAIGQLIKAYGEGTLEVAGDIYEGGEKLSDKYGGVSSYPDLSDLPSVNDVQLIGNKTSDDLGLYTPNPTVIVSEATVSGNGTRQIVADVDAYDFYVFDIKVSNHRTTVFVPAVNVKTSQQEYYAFDGSSTNAGCLIWKSGNTLQFKRNGSTSCTLSVIAW